MPELPEVESVRRGLVDHVVGRRIDAVETFGDRVVRYAPQGLESITGSSVHQVFRRGKYLWFDFGDSALVAHLGMSGQFRVNSTGLNHVRARFYLSDGCELAFVDQRTFGHLTPNAYVQPDAAGERLPAMVAHIARDLVDPRLDLTELVKRTAAKHSQIKRVLLDQSVVSGIGNIYADEALFQASIHPEVIAADLPSAAIAKLYRCATDVLNRAIAAGGTSFDSLYVNVNGESGYFDRSLEAYGRAGRPCTRCGTALVRTVVGGRSSHFCPKCQRRQRQGIQL
ncbi:bifunctional DNA-formamidopyrimidine glycosylase/DNA-(apurinic or apyrimidinic site) lyase [Changpingibacter yushuensis]|uniref:bifunctional DNA-formamidopyrimidine glycosylase/DNA-(apurinic or apyrimidinic site) lyase n=1 Tax=Changpingibacter yushuensis TaxID=2758440 RepID=UPI00165D723A|nr:bifunctional DNA-formamidopyrimidine glycosylase/DNA-(apurinic or apyrimidinic site) lyase [Changpingibacter yushuensis]